MEKLNKEREEEEALLRSDRFMDYNEEEINEYVSVNSEDENQGQNQIGVDRLDSNSKEQSDSDDDFLGSDSGDNRSLIYKPFKPGYINGRMR